MWAYVWRTACLFIHSDLQAVVRYFGVVLKDNLGQISPVISDSFGLMPYIMDTYTPRVKSARRCRYGESDTHIDIDIQIYRCT